MYLYFAFHLNTYSHWDGPILCLVASDAAVFIRSILCLLLSTLIANTVALDVLIYIYYFYVPMGTLDFFG